MNMSMHIWVRALGFGSMLLGAAQAETKIERAPLEIKTNIELGQIVDGRNGYRQPDIKLEGQTIQRTGVSLNQATTVNDRLTIKVGVGGLFFYTLPEDRTQTASRTTQFGPGVGQAQGIFKAGDLAAEPWTIQFGLFPYKYNNDAKNLGEYLLRSGTYPGYEVTGGWNIMNSAMYMASGIHVNKGFGGGKFTVDANIFMERDIEPLYDFTPSLMVNFKPGEFFELGGGAVFSHLIPVHKRGATPNNASNKYRGDSVVTQSDDTLPGSYYTFKGIKVGAHAALNFGSLIDNEWIGKNNLKLYGEVALLGVENYPYYYEKPINRMPMMAGFNWPTFKLFDVLATEVEYRRWDFPNDIYQAFDSALPIWNVDPTAYDPKKPGKDYNWKWTVYGKRKIVDGVTVYAQAASDYMRSIRPTDFSPERLPITRTPSQWYYLFRFEFSI